MPGTLCFTISEFQKYYATPNVVHVHIQHENYVMISAVGVDHAVCVRVVHAGALGDDAGHDWGTPLSAI